MSFTRYTKSCNFNELPINRKELDSIKQQLQESCYFVLSPGTQFGAKMNHYPGIELIVRHYNTSDHIHYHVTNAVRRKLLKLMNN